MSNAAIIRELPIHPPKPGMKASLGRMLVYGLIAAMVATAEEFVVTLGCLALSALFILTPWEVLRIRALGGGPAKGVELNAI